MVPTGRVVHVRSPEEKGSDVNMGAYLLLDCFENLCEAAVLVSGDSDLAEPVRLASACSGGIVCNSAHRRGRRPRRPARPQTREGERGRGRADEDVRPYDCTRSPLKTH
jgi:hypothetical protein